jgi:hypothetical protein
MAKVAKPKNIAIAYSPEASACWASITSIDVRRRSAITFKANANLPLKIETSMLTTPIQIEKR